MFPTRIITKFFALSLLLFATSCAQESVGLQTGDAELTPVDPHQQLFLEERYPSAQSCRTCHPRQYREWSVSPHAYAQLSPVFNAMHGKILQLTNGTLGDFCIRCHTPVGMAIHEPLFGSNLDRHPTSREGLTCIACHRVNQAFGKVSGRRALVEGALTEPVVGPTGSGELQRVIASEDYKVTTESEGTGRRIHNDATRFFQLVEPSFCGACHDVTLPDGFRLEEAFSEYKTSPAAARGESCQDCHMGHTPGVAAGYAQGPAAVVGGIPTRERRASNHMFVGPDYSVVHPGIYPHNPDLQAVATLREWLQFDVDAGWGTDEFEDEVAEDAQFPERWSDPEDRYDGRELLEGQLELLAEATEERRKLLRRGYRLGRIQVDRRTDEAALKFRVEVKNGTDGHNVPTGFTAERIVFLRVEVSDADGNQVFVSGDLDPNGDLRDSHSVYVHNGELPIDEQLFSLQSRFLTRNIRGGEREQVLAVNHSADSLPFVRPETFPSVLTGRPGGARLHRHGIEPGGSRWAPYRVEPEKLQGPSPHQLRVQLIAGMVPVNLVDAIKDVGFDYGMSPREVADKIVEGHLVLWESAVVLNGEGGAATTE
ncbi:MAG: multiheme c-type cytochrome [Planctomycetota bacterium]